MYINSNPVSIAPIFYLFQSHIGISVFRRAYGIQHNYSGIYALDLPIASADKLCRGSDRKALQCHKCCSVLCMSIHCIYNKHYNVCCSCTQFHKVPLVQENGTLPCVIFDANRSTVCGCNLLLFPSNGKKVCYVSHSLRGSIDHAFQQRIVETQNMRLRGIFNVSQTFHSRSTATKKCCLAPSFQSLSQSLYRPFFCFIYRNVRRMDKHV